MIVHTISLCLFLLCGELATCVLSKCFNLPKNQYHNLNEVCRQWRGLQELCRQKAIKSAYMYSFSSWNHHCAPSITLWCEANDTHTAPQLLLKVTKIFCESATLQSCEWQRACNKTTALLPERNTFYSQNFSGDKFLITHTVSRKELCEMETKWTMQFLKDN